MYPEAPNIARANSGQPDLRPWVAGQKAVRRHKLARVYLIVTRLDVDSDKLVLIAPCYVGTYVVLVEFVAPPCKLLFAVTCLWFLHSLSPLLSYLRQSSLAACVVDVVKVGLKIGARSKHTTSSRRSTSSRTMRAPTNPVPPVTIIVISPTSVFTAEGAEVAETGISNQFSEK